VVFPKLLGNLHCVEPIAHCLSSLFGLGLSQALNTAYQVCE
jgi:hypothetical protein